MLNIAVCDETMQECIDLEKALRASLHSDLTISKHDNYFSFMTYVQDEAKGAVDMLYIGLNINGASGVKIAMSLLDLYPHLKIIFVTKYLDLVRDIFMIEPVYLLIKPYEKRYVSASIYKVMRMIDENKDDYLILKAKYGRNGILSIKMAEIYYAASDKRKLTIYTDENTYEMNMKLNELEEKLPDNFIRVHQSYLVNMDKILSISKDEIYLYNDQVIPISRSHLRDVNEAFKKHMNVIGTSS